jgi:hypothetical protein
MQPLGIWQPQPAQLLAEPEARVSQPKAGGMEPVQRHRDDTTQVIAGALTTRSDSQPCLDGPVAQPMPTPPQGRV